MRASCFRSLSFFSLNSSWSLSKIYEHIDISMPDFCYVGFDQKETTIKSVDFFIYNLSTELYILV